MDELLKETKDGSVKSLQGQNLVVDFIEISSFCIDQKTTSLSQVSLPILAYAIRSIYAGRTIAAGYAYGRSIHLFVDTRVRIPTLSPRVWARNS